MGRRQHLLSFVNKMGTGFIKRRGCGLIPLHTQLHNYHLKNAKALDHLKKTDLNGEIDETTLKKMKNLKIAGKGTPARKHDEMGGRILHRHKHSSNETFSSKSFTPLKFNY